MSGDYAISTHMKLFLTYSAIHTQYTRYLLIHHRNAFSMFTGKYLKVTNIVYFLITSEKCGARYITVKTLSKDLKHDICVF